MTGGFNGNATRAGLGRTRDRGVVGGVGATEGVYLCSELGVHVRSNLAVHICSKSDLFVGLKHPGLVMGRRWWGGPGLGQAGPARPGSSFFM